MSADSSFSARLMDIVDIDDIPPAARAAFSAYQDISILGLTLDSRRVASGDAFFALQGAHVNGWDFIADAIDARAGVVFYDIAHLEYVESIVQQLESNSLLTGGLGCINGTSVIPVIDLVNRLSQIAANFYQRPSRSMPLVGITGTNGKTTCAWLSASLISSLGRKTGLVGTLGYGIFGVGEEREVLEPTGFTTPDALATQQYLAELRAQQCQSVVMEVSSHALAQGRVACVDFEIAVFTNISRDHLDFHGTMEAYAAAKQALFTMDGLSKAVVNIDDEFGGKLIEMLSPTIEVMTFSTRSRHADIFASDIRYLSDGIAAKWHCRGEECEITLPLMGEFNLSNALAAVAVTMAHGYPFAAVLENLAQVTPVAGRMQLVELSGHPAEGSFKPTGDITVIVDYAHTPDALAKALQALRKHTSNLLICVFGCGGDRDRGKRAEMGRCAEAFSDKLYITSDNPRGENPLLIIADITNGLRDSANAVVEPDREKAISRAINTAEAGSVILIAGKGHERYQEIDRQKIPFVDYDIAQAQLAARCAA